MSFDYGGLATTAHKLLKDFGASATLTDVAAGVYNPATGKPSTTQTDYAVVAAIFDMPERRIDGTRILTGDRQVFMSTKSPNGRALAITPRADMAFTDGSGTTYKVINVKPLTPALTAVLFELQVRR